MKTELRDCPQHSVVMATYDSGPELVAWKVHAHGECTSALQLVDDPTVIYWDVPHDEMVELNPDHPQHMLDENGNPTPEWIKENSIGIVIQSHAPDAWRVVEDSDLNHDGYIMWTRSGKYLVLYGCSDGEYFDTFVDAWDNLSIAMFA